MKKPPAPPRAVKKHATRLALIDAAHRRFHLQGFESTTIDEICADAGVARRTFFRYFANKEAIVFPQRAERLQRFLDLLQDSRAPASPVAPLREIARLFAREYSEHRESLLAQQRLIDSAPSLVAREREIDGDWEHAITDAAREHLGESEAAEIQARQFAGAAIGAIRATMRYWFERGGAPDLARLGQAALDALEQGFFRR